MPFTAIVRVTGEAGRFEDFRERVRWLMVRDIDAEDYSEHHQPGLLEYRFEIRNGIPFPAFVEATRAFEELRVEVKWDQDGARGGAAIEAGRLVDKWTGDRSGLAVVPRQKRVQCVSGAGLHRMAYWEWGDAANPEVLVCVHGLTRCARDFDSLARALCGALPRGVPRRRGRGDSDWLADPRLYAIAQYVADMVTLIARLDVERVHWVGTSMGGLIGMALAAQKDSPVAKLVLNDAGPGDRARRARAHRRVPGHRSQRFPSVEAAEQVVRAISAPFGPHSDAEWRHLTESCCARNADGSYRFHYDPRIAEPYRQQIPEGDIEAWPTWDAVRCPTLVIRGARVGPAVAGRPKR
jgi:pimeloyl-ACP methyl ester carboxylesterase